MTKMSFGDQLSDSLVHKSFRNHPFFTAVDAAEFTKEQAEILIQQWRHPLHYFPTFLARSIAVLPDIASKTAITRILNQEVGDGSVARAHEVIYRDSMHLWKLWTAFFDRLNVEADINQSMSTRGEL